MPDEIGKHDSRTLDSGETVHLTKHPGSSWEIKSYDWSWPEPQHLGPLGVKELKTATVYAQDLGWQDRRFGTVDEAYEFVAGQIRAGKAAGARHT